MATDCVPCHFDFEEKELLPHLPMRYRVWLRQEHRQLKERGYPAKEVIEHAKREMPLFRRYCPPHLVVEVADDHRRFHPVLERCAAHGLPAPLTAIG